MVKIVFSEHAIFQTKYRKISKKFIIDTVNNPDKILLQENLRKQAIKIFKQKNKEYLIIVIFEEKNEIKNIITAFITSKIKKYFKL